MTQIIQPTIRKAAQLATQQTFGPNHLEKFLENGWILRLRASGAVERFAIGWGPLSRTANPITGAGHAAVFAPDFYLEDPQPWLVSPSWDVVERDRLASLFSSIGRAEVNVESAVESQEFRWVEPELSGFQKSFEQIFEGFEERGVKKAVPIVFATSRAMVSRPLVAAILRKLLAAPLTLKPYGFWSASEGLLGATPEDLFTLTASESAGRAVLKTMALAGTRAKTADPVADASALMDDPKERHEHQLVVEDIRRVLAEFGKTKVGETTTVELPTLLHLKTAIEAEVDVRISLSDFAKALHPTPALGVSPRALGFNEMKRWDDPKLRGGYGAPFGIQAQTSGDHGEAESINECLVSIRNVQWQGETARIGSGCGIVPQSELVREWQELKLKRESVKRLLGL